MKLEIDPKKNTSTEGAIPAGSDDDHQLLSKPFRRPSWRLQKCFSTQASSSVSDNAEVKLEGLADDVGASVIIPPNILSKSIVDEVFLRRYDAFPLAQSLLRYEEIRTKSMHQEGMMQIRYPKSNAGWIPTMITIHGRALDLVVAPWILAVAHAALYVIVCDVWFHFGQRDVGSLDVFFALVLNSTLSFMLVFRLNRAAGRFWQARECWGNIVAKNRTLVGGLIAHFRTSLIDNDHNGQHRMSARDDAIRWIAAFAISTMELLRGSKSYPRNHFAGILNDQQIQQLINNAHPPLFAIDQVRYYLTQAFAVTADMSPSLAQANIRHLDLLERSLNAMMDSCGGMERIRGTPLPIAYVSHLRTFMVLSLLFFPYIWGPSWRWGTIPIVAMTAFAWLGIEASSAECEAPFRQERANALDMDGFCIGLLCTIQQQVVNDANLELERKR